MVDFDIVILGGGLVGASLACALQGQPFKIAVIDKIHPKTKTDKNDAILGSEQNLDTRALALSYTSLQCLKTIGVWQGLNPHASPILTVHASKKGHFGETKITALEHNVPELGKVVSADDLLVGLHQYLLMGNEQNKNQPENHSPIQFFMPNKITQLTQKEDKNNKYWVITLESGETLTASLLVGADGVDSYVRKFQGISVKTYDFQQVAIVANIVLGETHQNVAYERFLDNGAIAMLPFGEHCVKSVWIAPELEAKALLELSAAEYLKKLQEQFGFRLGYFKKLGNRSQYPLRSAYTESIYGNGYVLIGNAANTLTPVAAQGFNLGLRDVASLAEKLVEAHHSQLNIGGVKVLAAYAKQRQFDHQSIRQLTDKLAKSPILQWLGVLTAEWISPIKNGLVAHGLGRQQVLPSLCRGIKLVC